MKPPKSPPCLHPTEQPDRSPLLVLSLSVLAATLVIQAGLALAEPREPALAAAAPASPAVVVVAQAR